MKKRNYFLGLLILILLSGSLVFLVKKEEPLYQESNDNYLNSVYKKVQLDDDISKTDRNIITETVKKMQPYSCRNKCY
jgi:hypothetical protein